MTLCNFKIGDRVRIITDGWWRAGTIMKTLAGFDVGVYLDEEPDRPRLFSTFLVEPLSVVDEIARLEAP